MHLENFLIFGFVVAKGCYFLENVSDSGFQTH